MRIIKDISTYHIDDRFYDENTPKGKLIMKLSSKIGKEKEFLVELSKIEFWDYPKLSLWSFEQILNYIDDLLSEYKLNIVQKKDELNIIFNFYKILFNNCINKDVFSSFDHLQEIFLKTFSIEIKVQILEIYAYFIEANKTIQNYFMDFEEFGGVLVSLQEILIEILLENKYNNISQSNIKELEKNFNFIQKDWKKIVLKKNSIVSNNELKIKEISATCLFNKIVNEKKDFSKKELFLEHQMEYEYFISDINDKSKAYSKEEKKIYHVD